LLQEIEEDLALQKAEEEMSKAWKVEGEEELDDEFGINL